MDRVGSETFVDRITESSLVGVSMRYFAGIDRDSE